MITIINYIINSNANFQIFRNIAGQIYVNMKANLRQCILYKNLNHIRYHLPLFAYDLILVLYLFENMSLVRKFIKSSVLIAFPKRVTYIGMF